MSDRAEIVHQNLLTRVAGGDLPARRSRVSLAEAGLTRDQLVELFRAQALSRQLDRMSRKLQAQGQGFYTIGSSGHEGNAAIAAAFRPDDIAFLHYRDAAFQIARSFQVPDQTPVRDMLLSFACSTDDPISGGRHKVLGSKALNIPPQTSTIASHLPKAVGAAYSIGLSKRIRPEHQALAEDGVVLCSFGDASLNHSTAQGALNAASWAAYQSTPLPLVFICEDNGIGISVKTPDGWVEASVRQRPALRYAWCDGLDLGETYSTARELGAWVRNTRRPAFLHLRCVRLYGHAGPDAQEAYLSREEIEAAEANDPLLHSARRLTDEGLSAEDVLALYEGVGQEVEEAAAKVVTRPRLETAEDVMASLIPPKRDCAPAAEIDAATRDSTLGKTDARAIREPQHMAKLINFALTDLMLSHQEIVLAGEDVGRKGGVYGVTQRLQKRFGQDRVIDTLLDEQSILGLSIGLAHNGFVPIPEIQFLAYLHNAEDQLRGEAATLPFFSKGQFTNPMVIRIAGLGYQRGFGGHFHNDNSLAVLRDIPGVVVACPSNGRDAARMLREAVRLAREEQRVVVFVEPIALYMTRDLHEEGDDLWAGHYPDAKKTLGLNDVRVLGDGMDLAIVTYGNGAYLAAQAQKVLAEAHEINARVIDMRWLAPMPADAILDATAACPKALIVDECRITGSQSEALMAMFAERAPGKRIARYAAEDSFIATGPAYGATLPSRDGIVEHAVRLVGSNNVRRVG